LMEVEGLQRVFKSDILLILRYFTAISLKGFQKFSKTLI